MVYSSPCQSDLPKDGFLGIKNQLDDYCREKKFLGWCETSAKENIWIDEAMHLLVTKMVENGYSFKPAQKPEGTKLSIRSMLFGSKDKTVVSAEAATTPLSEENTAEAMARSDEIHELQAEKTQLMGRADYYKCLSQQFEHQLQHAVQLYQQSQTQLIQLEQNVSIRNEEVDKTIRRSLRVQEQLDSRLKSFQAQIQPRSFPQVSDKQALDQHVVHPKRPLKFDKKIGQGCYGSVYAVELNGMPCIAKRLLDILMGRELEEPVGVEAKDVYHRKFLHECVLLSQMKHTNIVEFIGVHYGHDQYDLTLLMERLSTDLHKYLIRQPDISLSQKVSILHNVSSGLLYLHEHSVIHRDLSAANILLSSSLQAKIADLGVSRVIDHTLSELSNIPGTLAYMPPEALRDRAVYNESLDIFSYGVIALFAAIQEFPEFCYDRVPDAVDGKGEGEIYKRRVWIEKMKTRQPELLSLVLWCLRDGPLYRPSTVCLDIFLQELHKDFHSETNAQDK